MSKTEEYNALQKVQRVREIESIEFRPITNEGWYKLKKVEINHPAMNVLGLIWIEGDYYKKEYVRMPLRIKENGLETIIYSIKQSVTNE